MSSLAQKWILCVSLLLGGAPASANECSYATICGTLADLFGGPKGAFGDLVRLGFETGAASGLMSGSKTVVSEVAREKFPQGGTYQAAVSHLENSSGGQVASNGGGSGDAESFLQAKRERDPFSILLDSNRKVLMDGGVAGCHSFKQIDDKTIGCERLGGVDALTIQGIKESNGFTTTADLAKKRSWSSEEIADSIDFDICRPAMDRIEGKQLRKSKTQNMGADSDTTKVKIGGQEIKIRRVAKGYFSTCTVTGLSKKMEGCTSVFLNQDGSLECRSQQGIVKVNMRTKMSERKDVLELLYLSSFDSEKNMKGDQLVKLWKDEYAFRPNIEDVYHRSKGTAAAPRGSSQSGTR